MHIVSDVHHCMQHTPFIVYAVQDCQTMGWQARCVLTLSLPGSVHGMVHTQHWCLFAPTFWLWSAPNDLHAFIKSRQRDGNGVTTTVADYGDKQVNREHTMGAGHKGVASGTQYHSGRHDGSIRCTTTRCNNHSSILWRQAGGPRADNGCRAHGCYKWDTIS
jgi:hypothetical protein